MNNAFPSLGPIKKAIPGPIKKAIRRMSSYDARDDFVLSKLCRNGVGVEVGVWKGDFSVHLLRSNPQQLILVDPWLFRGDYPQAMYGGLNAASQDDMDLIFQSVISRFSRDSRVKIHRASSVAAAQELPDESLDWVYIDGDHIFESVRDDLIAWTPKVKPGGLVIGDDYEAIGWWEGGVRRAVDDFVRRKSWPLVSGSNQFMFRVPAPQP